MELLIFIRLGLERNNNLKIDFLDRKGILFMNKDSSELQIVPLALLIFLSIY